MGQDVGIERYRGRVRKVWLLVVLWVLLLSVDLAAGWGITRVDFDDGLSKVFESRGEVYDNYQAYLAQFEAGEGDLLVVFSGRDFADDDAYEAVREFIFEVQFEAGVAGLISPFSFELPAQSDQAVIDSTWRENPGFRRFLAEDRQVLMVTITASNWDEDTTSPLHDRIGKIAGELGNPVRINARVTGYPALRDNVVQALFDDFLLHIISGTAIGTILASLALRSVALALLTTVTAGTALVWMLGLFGWAGLTINVVTISLPVLILVLSFASCVHLILEVGRRVSAGDPTPVQSAVRRIAPASILATFTTAAAFASLITSPSVLISEMGLAGALATLVSLLAVFVALPLLLASFFAWRGPGALFGGERGKASSWWHMRFLQDWAAWRPGLISFSAVIFLAIAVGIYLQVEPVHSLYDNVARDSEVFQALEMAEERLAPIGTIVFPVNLSLSDADALDNLRLAENRLRIHADPLEVVSLASFVAEGDNNASNLPAPLMERLVSGDGDRPLVMVMVPNKGSVAIRHLVNDLTDRLEADPNLPKDLLGAPTGLLSAAAFLSRDMLLDLNRCFLVAVVACGLVVMVWLRNPLLGLVALVANVLPVALVGAWLTLSGSGLEFSSGIALTIAFGLAIDDTIHVLNRIRLNTTPDQALSQKLIRHSLRQVAPALVITSVVLSLGLISTQFSQLPTLSYFGRLSIAAFVLALIADLLVLPACLIAIGKLVPARMLRIGSW